ncbi:serine/threonine-protein kinase [Enhygromyxa salina]|nr:serine/threonine-protein kinase [Enhygromyxa salina]
MGAMGATDAPAGLVRQHTLIGPSTRIARFVILDELGRGGMGIVHAAYDTELDRRVAIKLVHEHAADDPRQRRRIQAEARALARLNHPNVVQIHDVGEHDDRVYLAMEYVIGQPLRAWQTEPRTWTEIIAVYLQCGEGLRAAHLAGLIHRDFKPDNAILGEDGRVRVLDFGLAQVDDEGSEGTPRIVGTPGYMAPELFSGHAADARSDQFALCAALFEALHGRRPFATQVPQGPAIVEPGGEVPSWLQAVVARGLSEDPEARWPDLGALLAALSDDPSRRRRRRWGLLALVSSLGLASVAALRLITPAADPEPPCGDADEALVGVWDLPRASQVRDALLNRESSYAEQAWPRIQAHLDAYARSWTAMHRDACMAHQRGEQSDELLDRRMACLAHRRVELAALVDVLANADDDVVEASVRAALGLPDVAECGDLVALRMELAPPSDAALAQQVEALRARLARASAEQRAGHFESGLDLGTAALADADALGYRPLIAEAQLRVGFLLESLARYADAERTLIDAYLEAEVSHHAMVRLHAAKLLAFVVGVRLARTDDGLVWARNAQAIADAIGASGEIQADLLTSFGTLAMRRGEGDRAIADLSRAVQLYERELGPLHPRVSAARLSLGAAYGERDQLDLARGEFERVLAIVSESYGDRHPSVAAALNNLGATAIRLGAIDQAADDFEAALDVYEGTLGLEHPQVAATLSNLGTLYIALDRVDEAAVMLERALTIRERTLAPGHPQIAYVLNNLGNAHAHRGEFAQASDEFGDALTMLEHTLGDQHPSLIHPLTGSGSALVELGRHSEGIALLERALALADQADPAAQPVDRALTELALGKARWQLGHRAAGREQVDHALEVLRAAGPIYTHETARAQAWRDAQLSAH